MPGAYIAVIGPGSDTTDAELAAAEEVGRLLARSGATVVCGGLGGVMAAVSKGARSNGGVAVGLLPGREHGAGNAYLTVELPTGQGEMRNALVVTVAEAVIAIGGSWGTLSEIALAMRTGTPVFQLAGWPVRDPGGGGPQRAATAAQAVSLALAAAHAARAPTTP